MSISTSPLFLEAEDWLRYSPSIKAMLSWAQLFQATAKSAGDTQTRARAIQRLCSAARLAPPHHRERIERKILALMEKIDEKDLDWSEFYPPGDPSIFKAAILKPYLGPKEKGVLFVSFEFMWMRLIQHCDIQEFARRYTLVVAPTWNPPHCLAVTVFPQVYPDPIFSCISSKEDLKILPRLSSGKIIPVPLLASNWVNPALYHPLPTRQRDIDILMVASFGKYKRHYAFFKALRQMPKGLRVRLIGTPSGGWTKETLLKMAQEYGVEDRLVEIGSVGPYQEVVDALCRARISLIMSRREGSCVAVVESMFANTPVGLLADAEVGSKQFINDRTGKLLREESLAEDLTALLENAEQYSPRAWVDEHGLSCHGSTHTLNEALKTHALKQGQCWTQDIVTHAWMYDPQILNEEDQIRLQPEYKAFKSQFGIQIG